MGKRELLLVVLFVAVGVVVYHATAPEAAPGDRSTSLSSVIDALRRHVRGNRATAEATTVAKHPLDRQVTELRVTGSIGEVEITGEERADVETSVHVESNGYDEAEAREYVKQSRLVADAAASALILRMEFPRGGNQRGTLKVKVPGRLHVRVEPGARQVSITGVAAVELADTRGEAAIRKTAGKVEISHRGGDIEVEEAGALEFTGRAGSIKVAGVTGPTSLRVDQGGEIVGSGLRGTVDIDGRNAEVELDDLSDAAGPIRVNLNGGSVRLGGVRADTRVDARNAEVSVRLREAAPLAIYANSGAITVTPPTSGFTLDAVVTEGQLRPDGIAERLGVTVTKSETSGELRANGKVLGGGATLLVRATRADLTLAAPDASSTTR